MIFGGFSLCLVPLTTSKCHKERYSILISQTGGSICPETESAFVVCRISARGGRWVKNATFYISPATLFLEIVLNIFFFLNSKQLISKVLCDYPCQITSYQAIVRAMFDKKLTHFICKDIRKYLPDPKFARSCEEFSVNCKSN